MAIKTTENAVRLVGLAADDKTPAPDGSTMVTVDDRHQWICLAGTWYDQGAPAITSE